MWTVPNPTEYPINKDITKPDNYFTLYFLEMKCRQEKQKTN